MPIYDSNRTGDNDNTVVTVGENSSSDFSQLGTKSTGEKALHVLAETFTAPTSTFPTVPTLNTVSFHQDLLNGASKEMNVNGASTNVNFTYAPTGSQKVWIDTLGIYIDDSGVTAADDFGAENTLANGLQIIYRASGVNYTLYNMRTNMDITSYFASTVHIPASGSGFLSNSDVYFGIKQFRFPMLLDAANGDYIRFIVRDNLTGIDFLRASAHTLRII